MIVGDYLIDKVLDKIKEITCIEKFDDTKIFINTDDKRSDDITLKKSCDINMLCVIKDWDTFYPHLFLYHALYDE